MSWSASAATDWASGSPPRSPTSDAPALLVGMDTPQLTPALLLDGLRALARPDVDAVLGPTLDGGYWGVGFARPSRARSPACR